MFEIAPIDHQPIVRVVTSGFWLPETVEAYLSALKASSKVARDHFGFVHLVVDARLCPVHPPATLERLRTFNDHLFGPHDRIAVVVSSVLKRQQSQRNMVEGRGRAFLELSEAEAWLRGERP